MTDKQWEEYQAAIDRAAKEQEDDLDRKKLLEVTRQTKKEYQKRIEEMKIEVRKEAEAMPVYKVIHFLRTGEDIITKEPLEGIEHIQLDTKSLKAAFGSDILGKFPSGRKMHTNKGGVHHEEIAEMFGFESGLDMITQMRNAKNINKFIDGEAATRVAREDGSLSMDNKKLMEEAGKSIAGSKARGKLLIMELKHLSTKANIPGTPPNVIREIARKLIADKIVSDIHVKQARAAEHRAFKATEKAILKEDWAEATKQKTTQILNFFIYREAEKATEDINKKLRYLDRVSKPKHAKKLDRGAIDSINSLMEKVDLRRTVGTKKQNLTKWAKEQEAEGIEVPNLEYGEALLANPNKKHYKDMTYGEFVELHDLIKSIESIARYKQKILVENEKIAFGELVDELVNTAITEHGEWNKAIPDFRSTQMRGMFQFQGDFLASHEKMEFVFEQMDGDVTNGIWWRTFFKSVADAESLETEMNEKFIGRLTEIIESRYTRSERKAWQNTVQTRKGKFSKENIISIALNWGNLENRQAVIKGWKKHEAEWGINEVDVEAMLDRYMEAKDWEMVQEVWDLINELWPDIAALQKKLTGIVPPKVEAAAFQTRFGTMRGGYYPLYYSREFSATVDLRYEKELNQALYDRSSWVVAATAQGHTEARKKHKNHLVRMDLKVLSEHMSNVIHDLTHRETIYHLNRLMQNQQIQAALQGVVGEQVYKKIPAWIRRIANPRPPAWYWIDTAIQYANTSATMVAMGFKVTTALVQFFGYSQSVVYLGKHWAWRGLTHFYNHPFENKEAIFARSAMMRNRTKTLDRDIREAVSHITGKDSRFKDFQGKYFYFIGMMDMMVSLPTWQAAYEKSIYEGLSEEDAIAQGDSAVRMTQSSGSIKDLADIQGREEVFYNTFTKFYSYFSAYWNMSRRTARLRREGKITKLQAMEQFLWLTVLPATLAEAILGRGPNRDADDDNDDIEGWAWWAGINALTFRFNGMVGVRDIANWWQHPEYGVQSPWQDLFESAIKMGPAFMDIIHGEDNMHDWKRMLLGISYVIKLPGRQLANMLEHIGELLEKGEDFSMYELLVSVNRND
jgi:hypothetical protein